MPLDTPSVLDADTLRRLVPGGAVLNPISPDLTGIARTQDLRTPDVSPPPGSVGTVAVRGPTGDLAQNGRPPDTYIGNTAGTQPAWEIARQPMSLPKFGTNVPWEQAAPVIMKYESNGGQNIPNYRYDAQHTAGGYFQITDTNWRSYGPRLGIDTNKYPNAMSAPYPVQEAVAKQMYSEQGFQPWAPYNPALARAVGWSGGAGGFASPDFSAGNAAAQRVHDELTGAASRANDRADKIIGKIGDFEKDLPGALNRIHEARRLADEGLKKAMEAASQQPKPPVIDGLSKLGGLATIIGIFGGMLTKSPMIASLNAASSAIEAYKANDMEKYKLAFDSWKTNSDMMFKIADLQTKRANDIKDDERLNLEEKRTALDLYLRATGQQQLADEMRVKGEQFAYERTTAVEKALEQYKEQSLRIQEMHERMLETRQYREDNLQLRRDQMAAQNKRAESKDPVQREYNKWLQKYYDDNGGEEPTDTEKSQKYKELQEAFPKQATAIEARRQKQHDESVEDATKVWEEQTGQPRELMPATERERIDNQARVTAGMLTPGQSKNFSDPKIIAFEQFLREKGGKATSQEMANFLQSQTTARSPQAMMMRSFMQAHPGASADDLRNFYIDTQTMVSGNRYFTSGMAERTLRSFSAIADHLEVYKDAARLFKGGNNRYTNELRRYYETNFGGTAPANNLELAKILVSDELTRAVVGTAGALADREAIQKQLATASSWTQVQAIIDQAERFVAGQLHALGQTYENAGLEQHKPFKDMIKGNARSLFESVPPTTGLTYEGLAGAPPALPEPKPGDIQDGYRFKGGDKKDPNNWEKVEGR